MSDISDQQSFDERLPDGMMLRLGSGSLARTDAIVWAVLVFAFLSLPFFVSTTGRRLVALLILVVFCVLGFGWARATGCTNRPPAEPDTKTPGHIRRWVLVALALALPYMTYANAAWFRGPDWPIAATVAIVQGVLGAVVSWLVFHPHPKPVGPQANNTATGLSEDRLQLAAACAMRGLGCTPGWREVTDKRIGALLGVDRTVAATALKSLEAAGFADNRRQRGWNPGKSPDTIHSQLSATGLAAVEAELARLAEHAAV